MADVARAGLAIGGAIVGGLLFGPVGAAVGFSIANFLGGALFGDQQVTQGPRLTDLSVTTSTYGKGIPISYGTVPVPGNIIWGQDIIEVKKRKKVKVGLFRYQTQETFEYFLNFAISFGEGPVDLVRKIWLNELLVVDLSDENPSGRMHRYGSNHYRIYLGDEEQLPDPLIESVEGVGNVSAHRGQVYVVCDMLPLKDLGNGVPSLIKAEVVNSATATLTSEDAGAGVGQARDRAALMQHAPFFVANEVTGEYAKINRITNDVLFSEDLDLNDDFTAEKTVQGINQNVLGNIGRPFVDPTNGDVYATPEGTTGQGGGFAVYDQDFNFVLYQHNGTFGAPRNGRVTVMSGNRWIIQVTGLLGVDIRVRAWVGDPSNAENDRGILGFETDTSLATGINWLDFAYDSSDAFETDPLTTRGRTWVIGNDGSDNPYIVLISATGLVGTITNLTTSSTVPTGSEARGLTYDLNTDSLILVCLTTIFKLDPTTFAVIDEVGTTGNPASDAGVVGHIGGFMENMFNNQDTVEGVVHMVPNVNEFVRMDTADLSIVARTLDTAFSPTGDFDEGLFWDSLLSVLWATNGGFQKYFFDRFSKATVPVATILLDVASRCNLPATDVDVTAITDDSRGYVILNPSTGRAAIEPLQQAFFFDGAEIDFNLTFKPRDGASTLTIPSDDMAAAVEGQEIGQKFSEVRRQEVEVPRRVTVSYLDIDNDYNIATQADQRILATTSLDGITESRQESILELPMVFTDQEAREIAAKSMLSAWVERTSIGFFLPPKYQLLDPTDVVTVSKESPFGFTTTVNVRLIDTEMGDGGVIQVKALFQDAAVYTPNVTAVVGKKNPAPSIKFSAGTEAFLMNLPALRGLADEGGPAFFAGAPLFLGTNAEWRGAILSQSPTSSEALDEVAVVTETIAWGTTRTVLAAVGFHTLFDEVGTVDVRVQTGTVLASSTDLLVLAGANLVHVPLTGELFAFVTATLVGDNTYRLSRLLRGRHGTEGLIAQVKKNQKVVFIDQSKMDEFSDAQQRGTSLFYEVETIGDDPSGVSTQNFTNTAAPLLPLSPAQLNATRNLAGDLIIAWARRTRHTGKFLSGAAIPLLEATEEYELDVLEIDDFYANTTLRVTGDGPDGSTDSDDLSARNFTEAQSTFGSQAEIDTAQSQFGGASFLFNPSGSVDPSASFVSWPDSNAWNFAGGDFTAECWVRFADLTSTQQVFMSHFLNTGNNRSWIFSRTGTNIRFQYSTTGADLFTIDKAFTWVIDTWYHVAVSRKDDFLRMFVDGAQIGVREDLSGVTFFDSATVFYLGKIRATGSDDFPIDGHIDDVRVTLGVGRYDGNFNVPQRAQPTSALGTVVRTFTGLTTPTVTYTLAQQTTDFGGVELDPRVDAYQVSAEVGRGRARSVRFKERG